MKQTTNGQRGFTRVGAAVGLIIAIFLYFIAMFFYLPASNHKKQVFKWVNAQLSYITGRPINIKFESFGDAAITRINRAERNIVKQDRARLKILREGK